MNVFLLAIGGGLGAILRYLIGKWLMKSFPNPPFPVAMIVVNVIGSFGLGIFLGSYMQTLHVMGNDDLVFLVLGVGFFGAFTTFSTFSVEAQALLQKREWSKVVLYLTLTIIGSILAFILGYYILALK